MGYRIYHRDSSGIVSIVAAPKDDHTADSIRYRYSGLTPAETTEMQGWPDERVTWHDWDGCGQIGLTRALTDA